MNIFRERMLALAKAVYASDSAVASAPLVFMTIPIVALFQYPAHLINLTGHLDAGIVANEVLAVLGVPLIAIFALRFDRRRLLPFGRVGLPCLLALAGFMLAADVLMDFLTRASEHVLPLPEPMREQLETIMRAPDAQTVALKLVTLCIVPAVCEEIYFRGFFQTSLEAHWGSAWALAVTSVVFAAMHGNVYYFHLYVLLGLLFGWIFLLTRTLWAPIACHLVNNCWTFLCHALGFEIPLPDAPVAVNALIALGAASLFIAFAFLLRKKSGALACREG